MTVGLLRQQSIRPKTLWSYNPNPRGCEMFAPLWSPGMNGPAPRTADFHGWQTTISGGCTQVAIGRLFDGATGYIDLGDPFATLNATTSKTIIAWARSNKTNYAAQGRILQLHRTNATTAFALSADGNPGTWQGYYISGGGFVKLDSTLNVAIGVPTFLAFSQDGVTMRLQANDTVVGAADGVAPALVAPSNAYVGAYDNVGVPILFFSGEIMECYIFDYPLTVAQITNIREKTRGRYGA